jgi:predicted nucleic acid-binding Zn ribbon protein
VGARQTEPTTIAMPTYVYETIPQKSGDEVRRYEIRQSMKDAALTKHPETGEPIRRVITGGMGFVNPSGRGESKPAPRRPSHGGGCSCCH